MAISRVSSTLAWSSVALRFQPSHLTSFQPSPALLAKMAGLPDRLPAFRALAPMRQCWLLVAPLHVQFMRDVTRFSFHDFAASSLVRDPALYRYRAAGTSRSSIIAWITSVAFIAATLSTTSGHAHAGQEVTAPASSARLTLVSSATDTMIGAASPAGAGAAPADTSNLDPEQRAMELFRKGSELYSNAQYSAALDAFLDAQTLYPSPDFHYNIGACHEQLEDYDQAVRSFQSYLRNRPDAPDRANIEARIARLQRLVGRNPEKTVSQSPASPTTSTDASRPPDRDLARPIHPGRGLIITGSTVLAIGAVAGITGVVIYGQKARREDKILSALAKGDNPEHLTFEQARQHARNGQRAENLQFITAGIGGGVAIVGAVLLGLGLYKKNATARALTTGAQSWRSHLRPAVTFDQRQERVHFAVQGAF